MGLPALISAGNIKKEMDTINLVQRGWSNTWWIC